MLTDKQVRTAAPKEKSYKLADRNGLHLLVAPSGGKSWRYKFRLNGKEQLLTFGRYPDMSLAEAREQLDGARKALRAGQDPRHCIARSKLIGHNSGIRTFESIAKEWYDKQKDRWKPVHAADVLRGFERDLFPDLGHLPIDQIDQPLLLAVLGKCESRGAIETAHRLRQKTAAVFRYARALGVQVANPATDVKEAMRPVPPAVRYPALTTIEGIHLFLRDIDRAGASPITRLAARFLALTAQRPGMVRCAEWSEVHGVDWAASASDQANAFWIIPAQKMKQELHLRDDEAFEHRVPLSPPAVEVLQAVRSLTSQARYIFCNSWSGIKPMSENAIGYLYNREGYKGRHVPHGWRSSFSTIMNELTERQVADDRRLLGDRLIIDLMLAHSPKGVSGSEMIYNRAAFMPRRRELSNKWADLLLDGMLPANEIIDSPRRRLRS